MDSLKFSVVLYGLLQMMRFQAWRHPKYAARLRQKNFTAQIKTKDNSVGRYYTFKDGKIKSGAGIHPDPDMALIFKNAAIAFNLLLPPINQLDQVNAMKDFKITLEGPDEVTLWFTQSVMMCLTAHWKFGVEMANGVTRYVNMTNGGPVFLYVKDGEIVRMTPIVFDETDPQPWTIEARGKKFTPPRKTTLAPHGMNWKSMVYSPDRLL